MVTQTAAGEPADEQRPRSNPRNSPGSDPEESVPVLRISDPDRALTFYRDYLGFRQDWEHRFAPDLPLYTQLSRGGAKLHLSEHVGDASPAGAVLFTVRDVRALHAELQGRQPEEAAGGHPRVEQQDWGLTLTVQDPFDNRLTFHQPPDGPAPIRHRLELGCSSAHAFGVFTGRIGRWWDPAYSPDPDSFTGADIEPWVGGQVTMTSTSAAPYRWGTVTLWEPGRAYAQTFTLAQDPEHPSAVGVRFEPTATGCVVDFEHGGWTTDNAGSREKFTDWPHLLERFADLAGG
ncbi:glyoxalase superfamily protein [Ornithinicoccus hortensis]|uniref:Bleomycin resistance protein n=1 Tax=Ornithinicoccus hortensis TaxID=82346 RepID=A0A542YM24_9MICO|nr:glyoxalase superfamily protein [Ornithinicoccus hortensis]TQL49135.1 catechol 2,3-dioxygenase-like lactoylglutathione lyase family enzyme [Ornithinicoccus hortensis]